MHIYWYGQTCVKIQDNGVAIVIDPYRVGAAKSPRMTADVLLLTSVDFKQVSSSVSGDKFVIDSPGEYEVKGIFINAMAGNGDNGGQQVFYFLESNGVTLAHLGRIKKGELTDKQLEMFENVDILLIPVGDGVKEAAKLVNQIEPKIVIPIYYKMPKVKVKLDTLDNFKKQMAVKSEKVGKLSIKRKDIPQDDMKMIILAAQV